VTTVKEALGSAEHKRRRGFGLLHG
jgi:hypothetical protein